MIYLNDVAEFKGGQTVFLQRQGQAGGASAKPDGKAPVFTVNLHLQPQHFANDVCVVDSKSRRSPPPWALRSSSLTMCGTRAPWWRAEPSTSCAQTVRQSPCW